MANRCDDCGFDWDTPLLEKIQVIGRFPDRAAELLQGAGDAAYRRPEPEIWSPNEYLWHLVDVFRVFPEWLHMTRTLDHPTHNPLEGDQAAQARGYGERPVETALWALRHAIELFVQEAAIADPERQVTYKDWRDDVTAGEVIGFAAHEVVHHTMDVQRGLQVATV